MASCEIFLPTGINEEEKALIDEQLRIAKEENTTKKIPHCNASMMRWTRIESESKAYRLKRKNTQEP
jgi:hypothetical protein